MKYEISKKSAMRKTKNVMLQIELNEKLIYNEIEISVIVKNYFETSVQKYYKRKNLIKCHQ